MKAANTIFEEKDGIAENFNDIRESEYRTNALEAELIQQCIDENARITLDQTKYQKMYNGIVERFDQTKSWLDEVSNAIT